MSSVSKLPVTGHPPPTSLRVQVDKTLEQLAGSSRSLSFNPLGCLLLCCLWSACGGQADAQQEHAPRSPWKRFTIDDSLRGADGVRLADANGDGLFDITTGWEESGQTRAYFHPGKQQVKSAWPRVTVGHSPSIEDAVWIDLNGDGQLDILSSCEGREQSLRAHLADPAAQLIEPEAWSTSVIEPSLGMTRWMFAIPFPPVKHERKRPTIVVGSKSPHGLVGLLNYSAANKQWSIRKLVDAQWIMSLRLLDMDNDQDLDILYSDRKGDSSGVYWLENPKLNVDLAGAKKSNDSAWRRHLIGAHRQEVMFLAVTDHDAQTKNSTCTHEILVAVKPNHVYRFSSQINPRHKWLSEVIEVTPRDRVGTAKGIASGDLDADGVDELVFTCEGAMAPKRGVVYLKRNRDESEWSLHDVSGPEGIKFDLVELIDLDLDGDLDILTCEERHAGRGLGVIWYANPLH